MSSWFFSAIPYFLAGGTILLALFQLIKEWDEYGERRRLRSAVLVVLLVVAILSIVGLRRDSQDRQAEKLQAREETQRLRDTVEATENVQSDNTALFLKELSDLKAEVQTEALQKKLEGVRAELFNTQKALAPGPKAELTFTFVPFVNPPPGQPTVPVTDVTLPLNPDGSVHAEFTILNLTDVEATNAELQIQICEACKYAKEPEGLQRLPGMRDTERYLLLAHQQPHQSYKTITLDIVPPSLAPSFSFGFNYRCSTCILPKALSLGTVHIGRPNN